MSLSPADWTMLQDRLQFIETAVDRLTEEAKRQAEASEAIARHLDLLVTLVELSTR